MSRDIWMLLLLVSGDLIAEQAIGVMMPLAAQAGGASYAWVGVLSGAPRLILVLLLVPGTWLVAMWPRRTTLVAGVGLMGVATMSYAAIGDVRWMLLPQIILGVGLAIFWPAFLSLFAELTGPNAYRMQTRRTLAQGAALLLTPMIVTYLAQRFDVRFGFAAVGTVVLAAALVPLPVMSESRRPLAERQDLSALLRTFGAALGLLRRPAFALIVGLSLVASLLLYLVGSTFVTLHLRALGLESFSIGTFISLRYLSDLTLRARYHRIARRIKPVYLVAASSAGAAIIFLLLPLPMPTAAVAILLLLFGVFASQYDPAVITAMAEVLHADERDVGNALWITINALAGWIAAPALGRLSDAAGLPSVFVVSGVAGLVVVTVLMVWGRRASADPAAPLELVELCR